MMNISLLKKESAWESSESERAELFERLMRESYRSAYALSYRLTGRAAEAEDLLQEAYLRAYRFFDKFDQAQPFASWLSRIIANAHIDSVRRKGKMKTVSIDATTPERPYGWEFSDEGSRVDAWIQNEMFDDSIQKGLDAMNAEFRTAVLLADVQGLSYEEIAEVMRTSVGTVRSRIHRGRTQLRKYLSRTAPHQYGRKDS